MHTTIYNALAELEVPVTECPTCKTENWCFSGDVHKGIDTVRCMTCNRRYQMLTGFEEVEWLANRLASAAHFRDSSGASRIMLELYQAVSGARMGRWEYPRLVVTSAGVREDAADELDV